MTYPQQGQQPMTPYPSQPAPAARTVGSKRPRGWHVAATITVALFMLWFIVSALAATCPPPKTANPTYAAPTTTTTTTAKRDCYTYVKGREGQPKCPPAPKTTDPVPPTYNYSKSNPVCDASGGIDSMLMLGQLVGIVVTIVMGWKRRKTYAAYRKSVFAVDDYERRVPPGTEQYVDLATHQTAAAHAANASTEMFLNKGYWFAPSGQATDARIDSIRATGARAAAAAQQIQMSQYAPMDDDQDDLAAPDLGGGDTTSGSASDDADDWMSGVDSSDNDW